MSVAVGGTAPEPVGSAAEARPTALELGTGHFEALFD